MSRTILLATFAATLSSAGCTAPPLSRFEFAEPHMGTTVRVVLYAGSSEDAERASRAAFAAIAEVNQSMSDYLEESELSRLNREGEAEVSEALHEVLLAARRFSDLSGGAFDATVGPLVRLWRRGAVPAAEEIAAARRLVGYERIHMEMDPSRRVWLEPGTRIDLGAIAKGYACDRALAATGLASALVDAGGDLALGDPPPGEPGWRIAIPDGRTLVLSRCGVATSGDLERSVESGGRRYSHIVDPRTGLGIEGVQAVTVVAPDGMTADALATAISVAGIGLAAKLPGIEAAIWRHGGSREETPGFASFCRE
ncbi:MAG: FAD:protein FMN transferase [Planctomycetes bacterium]|nr:FAD:protein FMN transferase [Planctomycetota bacterium]